MDPASYAGLGTVFYSLADTRTRLDDFQHTSTSRLADLSLDLSRHQPLPPSAESVLAANVDGSRRIDSTQQTTHSSAFVNLSESHPSRLQSVESEPWTTVRAASPLSDYTVATGQNEPFKRAKVRDSHFEDDQKLLGSHRIRPKQYFAVGTVFDMSWAERSAAPDSRSLGSDTLRSIGMSQDSYGNWVYSNTKRFVVIREGSSSCTAVPISTYVGKGVSKRGVRKSDHCIVYTGTRAPSPLLAECPSPPETGMLPSAIRVSAHEPVDALDPTSRINFGKVYTVEHNHKVRSFGRVVAGSMPALAMQFKMVWSRLTSSSIPPVLEQHSPSLGQSSRSFSDSNLDSMTDIMSIKSVSKNENPWEVNGAPNGKIGQHAKNDTERIGEADRNVIDSRQSSPDTGREAILAALMSIADNFGEIVDGAQLPKEQPSFQPYTADRGLKHVNETEESQQFLDSLGLRELRACDRFRLVDVHSRTLHIVREPVQYCALSYVWGSSDQMAKHQPLSPGSILERDLPAQVLEAFTVVANLGHRYLWVDTICIDQASTDDKQAVLPHMRSIYSNASVTIVANSGADKVSGRGQFALFRSSARRSASLRQNCIIDYDSATAR